MARTILILNPPGSPLSALGPAFRLAAEEECTIRSVTGLKALLESLGNGNGVDLVVIDYFLGDGKKKGAAVLGAVRKVAPQVPIVAVAERGDVETAAEAVRLGATDFLVRGANLEERVSTLLGKIRALFQLIDNNRLLRQQNLQLREEREERLRIVGASPQIHALQEKIRRVARIPRPVLIVGERGTGKELVARAIHDGSDRADKPIITVNCAAFSDTLLESELFGHEKGAFTGADRLRHGRFEQADGGTLFLDEIATMSPAFQQKILRAVEYGRFTRVGGNEEIGVDVRIVAATNADLKQKIRAGEFLPDLFDRLSFEILHVPPLRERTGDIDLLAQHFLDQFMREIPALSGKCLARSALDVLRRRTFPGNVRELKNIIERAAYRDTTNEITPEDLGLPEVAASAEREGSFEDRVEAYRRSLVLNALQQAGNNQAQAARILGLSYHQFRYYYQKYSPGS